MSATSQIRRFPASPPVRRRPSDSVVAELAHEPNPLIRLLKVLGPGLIAGASDDDPSGVGTYAAAGARYGYGLLWVGIWVLPLMAAVQYICAKIGLVSGRGLAGVLRQRYPRAIVLPAVLALVAANTINAGADIGAIAAALNLVVPIPAVALVVPIGLGILALQVFGSYRLIVGAFKWLALALLAYVGAALFARPDLQGAILGALVPTLRLEPGTIAMAVALLGTTISPYLFFWQASHEVEAEMAIGRRRLWQRQGASKAELKYALWDVSAGMIASQAVAFFIMLATAATLHASGRMDIGSAGEAAAALRPVAGDAATLLFAIGLVGVGVLTVPILTGSAAYGVAEAFGWKFGLDERLRRAPQFYGVIAAATLVAVGLNFLGVDLIEALVVTALINGLLAAPILALIMPIANDGSVMGPRTNGRLLNLLGWGTTALMGVAALALVVTAVVG